MSQPNVWLFYPNLVGYGRIFFAIVALEAMPYAPFRAALSYAISAGLDAIDGYLARKYNQSSRFGAMLDQLTDRCALLAMVMCLCSFYPDHLFALQMSALIDIASHWLHLHATDITGKVTHKASDNPILHLYYTSREFLFWMCAGNEAFYGLLYINHFWSGPGLFGIHLIPALAVLCFPVAFVKALISLVHLVTAAQTVVSHDVSVAEARQH
ncbi:CDP-diacylglycerol--inositol 3-phosphatidyltransferase [Toxocara canis]|uniref:CDP-diacylglycerol--inositol 3-phosphatidyltransferase n=2 Tax=Toxocara canis TaxID=6265 RepID=A0A0B2V863_TOXCA|nr:CDP-diacylglycerol--inositol 3-phosphatidyltransferase [Toxocara canis]VDM44253.1 unnamed protein product [Toxocara canis]